jgi:hypothetical protein
MTKTFHTEFLKNQARLLRQRAMQHKTAISDDFIKMAKSSKPVSPSLKNVARVIRQLRVVALLYREKTP